MTSLFQVLSFRTTETEAHNHYFTISNRHIKFSKNSKFANK